MTQTDMAPHKTPHSKSEQFSGFPSLCTPSECSYFPDEPWERPTHVEAWVRSMVESFQFWPEEVVRRFRKYDPTESHPRVSGIYFLGLEEDIGYVGKATCVDDRLLAHHRAGKDFTHYWAIINVPVIAIDHIEAFYIRWLNPPLNRKPGHDLPEFLRERADKLKIEHPWPPWEG